MDSASAFSTFVKNFWDLLSTRFGYIYYLDNNVHLLEQETERLKARKIDLEAKMESEEEGGGVRRTAEMVNWLGSVDGFSVRVDQVFQQARVGDRITCLGFCPPQNCWSSCRLGEKVVQMLDEARRLMQKEFDTTRPLPPPPPSFPHSQVVKMPMGETVGLDISFDKVWKWLVDEQQSGKIGLYGTGGVGKTTLMKRINEKLSGSNHGFDIVIWVKVSRQVNEESIRDTIRKRLNIEDKSWEGWSRDDRVHHLWNVLTQKKFVLMIDNVWEELDLCKIGVPCHNRSKVVFTTREEQVCTLMNAKTLKIEFLKSEEALKLFEKNISKSLVECDKEIQDLAKDIVEECKGLPLALITVGRAMAGREYPGEWRDALYTLRNKPHKLLPMEEEVYHVLKFSYDSINDSAIQLCFLYCCLFPEDYPIKMNDLIEHWIGEGLLEDTDDVYHMRDRGVSFLGRLKRACLLESERHSSGEYIKMHDVIRDMATWIARDRGQRENKLLVIEKEEELSAKIISKWGEAKKVSLWGKWIRNIDQAPPRCSQLETLFVRETNVSHVPRGFFDSMTAHLTVLDLSGNRNIKVFPEGICDLINLHYLNLSGTRIRELPREIENLTRLRWLLLNNTSDVWPTKGAIAIPMGAIANLPLNVFSLLKSSLEKEEEIVEELGRMQDLIDLSIEVHNSSSVLKIFRSFQRRIRRLRISDCEDLSCIPISHSLKGSNNFQHLELLHLLGCPKPVTMEITQGRRRAPNSSCFPSLIEVRVEICELLDLSWLVHAPKLRRLTVDNCRSIEKIIGDEIARDKLVASELFSCLEDLDIRFLPKLRSICKHTLIFPQGVKFYIQKCPGLRKLPLDSNSARGSFSITADKDWWAKFDKDWWAKFNRDPAARVTFQKQLPLRARLTVEEEMTFGEAARKMEDESVNWARIVFLPHNEAAGEGVSEAH